MTERSHKEVTLSDVARAAGVGVSTASRTFARPGRVNAETAARVRKVAEELGYRASPLPSTPSSSQTRLIAVMVSDIDNPFFSRLVRGAQVAASEAGYEVLLADARESGVRERSALERILPVVDGIVIGSSRMPDSALHMIAKQKPMISLNRALRGIPSVIPDNPAGVELALGLLRDLGHESVVYVAGPEASWTDGVRSSAVRDLGARIGLRTHKAGPFLPTYEGGIAAAERLLTRLPTAIIAYNDLMAIGILRGLVKAGVRIPHDVSVIGFDDILAARLTSPDLTSIAAPMRQMGMTAVRNVIALINAAVPAGASSLLLPMKLKVRGSTAKPRAVLRSLVSEEMAASG